MNGTKKSPQSGQRADQERHTGALAPLDSHSQITQKLRAFYDSVQDEGIPDRFLDLLEKLDQAEKAAKPADDS
ncbi:NepR family anti-sigma factor [Breoghania sp. L-A4]|uniref:NepR family anti-sigma factor n=1 Tax=Breoghania sp. L-A4 TaxID=2304600 RepID=UPI000E35B0C7|nr:NepR family anti-sigma factor [Breoghania sp. L-A4]AXS40213.1 hypothetical protein D1F64_09275 [Breoghania sp. L-A4]